MLNLITDIVTALESDIWLFIALGIIALGFVASMVLTFVGGDVNKFKKAAKGFIVNPTRENAAATAQNMPVKVTRLFKRMIATDERPSEAISADSAVYAPYQATFAPKAPILMLVISVFASLLVLATVGFVAVSTGLAYAFVTAVAGLIFTVVQLVVSNIHYKGCVKTYNDYIDALEGLTPDGNYDNVPLQAVTQTPADDASQTDVANNVFGGVQVTGFAASNEINTTNELPKTNEFPTTNSFATSNEIPTTQGFGASNEIPTQTNFTPFGVSGERNSIDDLVFTPPTPQVELEPATSAEPAPQAQFSFDATASNTFTPPPASSPFAFSDYTAPEPTVSVGYSASTDAIKKTSDKTEEMRKRVEAARASRKPADKKPATAAGTRTRQGVTGSADELLQKIARAIEDEAPLATLKELALKLQQERAKPENKTPEKQKKLSETQIKLMRAMTGAMKR